MEVQVEQIKIEALPETDRVFRLGSGDYVRSRFRLKHSEACCSGCGRVSIGEGMDVPHLAILITMATCDETGELLRDGEGKPVHVKHHSFSIPKHLVREKTRHELFTMAKEIALPLMEAEIKIRREFGAVAPDLDEDLV